MKKNVLRRANGGLLTLLGSILGVYVAVITFGDTSENDTLQAVKSEKFHQTEEKELKKDQPGMFLKLHNYLQTETGKDRPEYTPGYQLKEFSKAQFRSQQARMAADVAAVSPALQWDERGPGNVSGRTPGVWVDLSDATFNTWLAGSSGGGIWKTTDGGTTWASKTDNLPNQTISGVMGSKADANIIYAGTGKRFANSSVPGNGILKSTDKGETWEVLASTLDDAKFANISRIAVDQSNANNIVASTFTETTIRSTDAPFQSYLYKSTDGGTTWTEMLNSTSLIQQVVTSETNFDLQFVSLNGQEIQRTKDGGTTWETVFRAGTVNLSGFALDRMEIAIAPGNDNHIFIAAYTTNSAQNQDGSLLIFSEDNGDNWAIVRGKDTQNNFGNWLSGQGWYDNTIAVHPYDDMSVYVAGVSVILKLTVENRNGIDYRGAREILADGYGQYGTSVNSKGVHVDHHQLLLLPVNDATETFHILNGNDGGIAISKDEGVTFKQTGDTFKQADNVTYETFLGYNTVEFYGVDKKNGGDRYVAGSQDNGSWVSGVDPGITSVWVSAPSGDGFQAAWHYTNTDLILESSQFNNIFRSSDEGATWSNVQLPVNGGPFVTEIENSKQDPDLVFMVSPQGLMRSEDFALTWETVEMPGSWRYSGFTTPVAISLASPEVVWSGTGVGSGSLVAVSKDGGNTFEASSVYTQATRGGITNITTHPTEEGTAYVMFSQANGPKVIKTTDYGETWADITGFNGNTASSSTGFPDVPAYSMVVMPYNNDIIWVGTAIGIVESLDGGSTWALKSDHNLPAVAIWDMRIVNDEVVIATHGRGIWSVTLPELSGYEPVDVVLSPKLDVSSSFYSTVMKGSTTLRSAYDATKILLKGSFGEVTVDEIASNTEGQVVEWQYDVKDQASNADLDVTVVIESTAGAKTVSRQKESKVFNILTSTNTYRDNLNTDVEDRILLDGISSLNTVAKTGNALHTPHPYESNSAYQFLIRTPLTLSSDTAILNYSDIALVEPGENNTDRIWDFVAVEGLKVNGDGTEDWVTIDRYDARRFQEWRNAYDNNTNPTKSLFRDQRLDLFDGPLNSFVQGDEILLRFSMYTDPEVEGYGWIVDDIRFNHEPEIVLNVSNDLPEEALIVYPNPIESMANFNYTLETSGMVRISMLDMKGAEVNVLVDGRKQKGSYQMQVDASELQAGTYFVKMETTKGSTVEKVIVR